METVSWQKRGFDIQDDLTPIAVKVNIPPFLRGKSQHKMLETCRVASVCAC